MTEKATFNFHQDYTNTSLFCGGPSGLFDTVNKKYPEIWAIYKQMKALDWDENETSFAPCMADFEKCDKSTYDMMIKTLAWQWEGDSAASRLAAIVAPFVSSSELWATWQRISDNECLTPDHDVLTLEGWKSIDAVTKYDKVAQWDQETNQIEFVHPAVFSKPFDGELIQFSNHCGTLNQLTTPKHRMVLVTPYESTKINQKVWEAKDIPLHGGMALPVSGKLKSGKGMTALEKLFVAVQADGSLCSDKYTGARTGNKHYKFSLKKQRKKERLAALCKEAGLELVQHDTSRDRDLFYVYVPLGLYNEHAKSFDWVDLNNISLEWCQEFIEELGYWDGNVTSAGNVRYISTNKECIDFAQTIGHLAGLRTNITIIPARKGVIMPDGNISDTKEVYQLYFTKRPYINGNTIERSLVTYKGLVYCLTVPSSFFLVRREGAISVTGNCIHAATYSEIVRSSFKDPSVIVNEILAVEDSLKRLDVVAGIMHRTSVASHQYALGMISDEEAYEAIFLFTVALLCLERIQFISSFAVTFAICDTGIFEPIGTMVQKIAQDELEVHVELDKAILRNELKTDRGVECLERNKEVIIRVIDEVVSSEMEWVDYLFSEGRSIVGMNADLLKQWVCFNAKDVYHFFKLKPINEQINLPKSNPLPFMEDWLNISKKQPSPQEQDVTQYKVNLMVRDDDEIEFDV